MKCIPILLFVLVSCVHHSYSKIRHARGRAKRQGGEGWEPKSWVWADEGGGEGGGDWEPWSPPSSCSRPCGGGVANQTRTCRSSNCWGSKARYFSCNIDDCRDGEDFRTQQCAEYNEIPYEGIRYDWVPYTKAPNRCALNCMPRGERFYYRHNDKVVDGTLCSDENLDVCVNGECKHVGCDKLLGSELEEDKCRVCGGDGSTCETKQDTLLSNDFKVGYNDLFMVPAGATNIRVKEVHPSNNYLAVRNASNHYYLNGNWRIDYPRILRFAGTVFHYGRKPHGFFAPESITALGPTNEILFIVLLYQERNPGIDYEYSLPKGTVIQTDPEGYTWFTDDFSECSTTCGEGFKSRRVWCAKVKDSTEASADLCDSSQEPPSTESCETQPCPPQWHEPEWSPCSVSCGNGTQTRQIYCEQVISSGKAILLNDSACEETAGDKPETVQPCGDTLPCPTWHIGPWKPCDKLCGDGVQRRMVQCFRKTDGKIELLPESFCSQGDKPETEKPCSLRPCEGVDWITGEWSGCSNKCGLAYETREAMCANQDGKIFNDSLCHEYRKPELKRKCNETESCPSQWYTSQWSPCSAKCGPGVQTRHVFCGTFSEAEGILKKVDESQCDSSKKFEDQQPCQGEEECKGEWFTGAYGQCSKPCGGGQRARKLICFKNNQTVKYTECDAESPVFDTSPCNTHPCGEDEILPVEPDSSVMEESSEECEDEEDEEDGEEESAEGEEDSKEEAEKMKATTKQDDEEGAAESFENVVDLIDVRFGAITPVKIDEATETEGSGDFSTLFTESGISSTDGITDSSTDGMTSEAFSKASSESTSESSSTSISDLSSSTSSDQTTSDMTGVTESSPSPSDGLSTESISASTSEMTPNEISISYTEVSSTESRDSSSVSSSIESSSPSSTFDISSIMLSDGTSVSVSDTSPTEGSTEVTTDSSTISSTMTSVSDTSSTDTSSTYTSSTDSSSSDTSSSSTTESLTSSSENPLSSTDSSMTSSSDGLSTESSTDMSSTVSSEGTTVSSSDSTETSSEGTTTSSSEGSTTSSDGLSSTTESTSESSSESSWASTILTSLVSLVTESSSDSSVSSSDDIITTTSVTEASLPTGSTSEGISDSTVITTETSEVSGTSPETTSETGLFRFGDEPSESPGTTVSGPTETDEVDETSASTTSWSQTVFGVTSSIDGAVTREQTVRTCKKKSKVKRCVKSEFGCCPDNRTPAKGPFGKDCPKLETCKDTKYGCCLDGVSPATGHNLAGCPPSQCNETLFGCCPNEIDEALGNDYEGCPSTTTLAMDCSSSEFGCCQDGILSATGPNFAGCFECETDGPCESCNDTKWGCCPDGTNQATGPDFSGCDMPTTTTELFNFTMGESDACENSTYGCCPNGITLATGPDDEGCETTEEPPLSCDQTQYGCCPDGKSHAEGPKFEGCETSCSSEPFGCCSDDTTPAHGPNMEGCCLNTEFGCCKDNIQPAEGPNYQGCSCDSSPYGCCPDGSTSASGPDNEGCGCAHTSNGCCPDKATPATGPNYEGCPCYTYQFGCCADGINHAKGPRQFGCGCEDSDSGCCPDGKTPKPAEGNCTCETSKFGCCLDGVSEAKGEKFEECPTKPRRPGDICGLPKDRGPCREFTVKWHYDTEYGGCSRFWFGSCEGNGNKFNSQEECKQFCVEPKGKDACTLPKITGPCQGYYPRYYYDSERKDCSQFIYGGCLGNNNKFQTSEECRELCVIPDNLDACDQELDPGPCQGNYERWFYNKENHACYPFQYGGCKGNKNNFLTEAACTAKCLSPQRQKSECSEEKSEGDCSHSNKLSRWYFDSTENRCMPFYYTGCGGNDNNFHYIEHCQTYCPARTEVAVCALPPLEGECHNFTVRYYFDTIEARCRQFYYGGCGGNTNNFMTETDCYKMCEPSKLPPEPEEPFSIDMCLLPYESGSCSESTTNWFFDSRDGLCKEFEYSGCNGNGNRFSSREECESRCEEAVDICRLGTVLVRCDEPIYPTWFYESASDSCRQYTDRLCPGNGNRFESLEACQDRCRPGGARPPPTQAPYLPDICWARVDPGPCLDQVASWWYDQSIGRCQQFQYGGCEGNANRFSSEEQCERQCGQFRRHDTCRDNKDVGSCDQTQLKFFYNTLSGSCEEFIYSGCGGNTNRYSTIEECQSVCIRKQEPPITPGRDTQASNQEICHLSVEPGSCSGYIERYHYDYSSSTCAAFVFTGCSANLNNFNSYDECMSFCAPDRSFEPNEVGKEDCYELELECSRLSGCSYGIERKTDSQGCIICSCHMPCDGYDCGSDAVCSVQPQTNPVTLNLEYVPICTSVSKYGHCPEVTEENPSCDEECSSDSECSDVEKCCYNGCGSQCVRPIFEDEVTTAHPQHPQGVVPPQILTDDEDTNVESEEGNFASMKCIVRGSPIPQISWSKDGVLLNSTGSKYRMISDGTLQVIGLIKSDSGLYICIAENGIGKPVTKEFRLNVNDGVPLDVSVLGEDEASIIVELGAPAVLACRAIGWPRPSVTWFRGSHMLPLSSQDLQQSRDNSLILYAVALPHLGFYTCQAYNGFARPASYTISVKAIGPAQPADPNDVTYDQFLVPPPRGPRPPPYLPRPRPTTQALPLPPTRRYTVPVRVSISLDKTDYTPGQSISIPCDVEGFPMPETIWYKNGQPLSPSDRITITDSNRLIIPSSEITDSGRYECRANNNYTSSEASIDILVKGMYIPSHCTDNPFFANCKLIVEAQYCKHEYYAKFCCKSCTENGQIDHTRSKRSIRGKKHSIKPRRIGVNGIPLPLLPKFIKKQS